MTESWSAKKEHEPLNAYLHRTGGKKFQQETPRLQGEGFMVGRDGLEPSTGCV